jgi:hypothetical protein
LIPTDADPVRTDGPERYLVSHLVIASSISLPEADAAPADRAADCRFTCTDGLPEPSRDWRWFHRWTLPDGTPWVSFGRRAREYLLAFDGVHFTFCPAAMSVHAWRHPDTPLVTVRHLLLNQVLPLVFGARGALTLHAGCVAVDGGAIAFLGESGAGKSTLVASFAAAGASIVSDDALVVEERGGEWWAVKSYPGVRLWPGTADVVLPGSHARVRVAPDTAKVRIVPDEPREAPSAMPLRRLYVLDPQAPPGADPAIRIERLTGPRAFLPPTKLTFRLDVEDAAALARDFARVASMVEQGLVRRLAFPVALSALGRVREAIAADLADAIRTGHSR